jgi:hypothetical protein
MSLYPIYLIVTNSYKTTHELVLSYLLIYTLDILMIFLGNYHSVSKYKKDESKIYSNIRIE